MNAQKKFLLFGLIPALLFQLVGAYLYFDLWADEAIAKGIYSATKILILVWPLLWWNHLKTPFRLKSKRPLAELAWGLGSGLFLAAGILLIFHFLPGKELLAEQIEEKVNSYFGMNALLYGLFSIFLCFGHSLLEEYYWRWFTGKGLNQFMKVTPALLLSNLAFASHHFIILSALTTPSLALVGTVGVFMGGMVWALLYQKQQTLFPAWISHACVDATLMGIGYHLLF